MKSNRIELRIASTFRIVIAVQIIMQSTFGIVILPRETEIVLNIIHQNFRLSESIVECGPNDCATLIHQLLRCSEMVVLIEEILVILLQEHGSGGPGGIGLVPVRFQLVAAAVIFRHQPFITVEKIRPRAINLFPQAPAEGIVIILSDSAFGRFIFDPDRPAVS